MGSICSIPSSPITNQCYCLFLLSQNERLLLSTFQLKLTQLHPMINSIFCCVQEFVSKHLLQAKLCTLWASTSIKDSSAFRSSMTTVRFMHTQKNLYTWLYELQCLRSQFNNEHLRTFKIGGSFKKRASFVFSTEVLFYHCMWEDTENIAKIRAAYALRKLLNLKLFFKSIPNDLHSCLQWGKKKYPIYPSLNCKCCIVSEESVFNRN